MSFVSFRVAILLVSLVSLVLKFLAKVWNCESNVGYGISGIETVIALI